MGNMINDTNGFIDPLGTETIRIVSRTSNNTCSPKLLCDCCGSSLDLGNKLPVTYTYYCPQCGQQLYASP